MSKANRPRNSWILFNQEYGPIISDTVKTAGGDGKVYRDQMSKMWKDMKKNESSGYKIYQDRSKRESSIYKIKVKKSQKILVEK